MTATLALDSSQRRRRGQIYVALAAVAWSTAGVLQRQLDLDTATQVFGRAVFAAAAQRGVAIEIDGDPARQDLDFTLARQALEFDCIFALDSDAHTTGQLSYAETALAHARLAGIPVDRIVNCWPLERLLAWLSDPSSKCRR